MTGAAAQVGQCLTHLFGRRPAFGIRAWDGSSDGTHAGPTVVLHGPAALRHIIWAPGELGVSRAYVAGDLDVEGDIEDGLAAVLTDLGGARPRITPATVARALAAAHRLGALGSPPKRPESEARPTGRLHSRERDAGVISHHYDLSNRFYQLLLDRSMAYSCGYWTSDDEGYSLADAQRDKLDLICRKLDLRPGARLLDVGCGWGALTVHAAREYGTSVTAVTVSAEQRAFVAGRLDDDGVGHLVDLRLCDYRDVLAQADGRFDAVAAIEMGEHVGDSEYPAFVAGLHASLRPGGRFLLQVMSRGGHHPGGGPFIERYIAPDMHMRPLDRTLALVGAAGFEIRDVHALREHYARTIRAWRAQMEARWVEVVALIGAEQARVWRLYLAGGALSFEANRMGVDQVLAVRTAVDGGSGMEPTRVGWDQPGRRPAARGAQA
ncbi:MAG TPA: cyclopropane-fatty-acyl-phospholipid synthase family protein [Acidimicrobiales bacterium]|nr:cyclopropane-fatty-acyl-phospholipid synthase family protein [Acidimicrobiales bacterium]